MKMIYNNQPPNRKIRDLIMRRRGISIPYNHKNILMNKKKNKNKNFEKNKKEEMIKMKNKDLMTVFKREIHSYQHR